MTTLSWVTVAVFIVVYVFIGTEWVPRATAALAGAVIVLVIGATDADQAFFSPEAGVDWNVIFLVLGMMLIVAVVKRTGLFEFLAIWAAKRAGGRPFRLMIILIIVTAVVSAALDNVTTVLLVAPVTFLVCERLGVPAVPFLIAEVMASNIGGTATLVGDPPNIIIASRAGLTFNQFLAVIGPFIVGVLIVFLALCRWLFRDALRYDPRRAAQLAELREGDAIRDRRLLVMSLAVIAVVVGVFLAHSALDYEPSVVAICGGLLLVGLSGVDPKELAGDVEWPTLAFFAGLFVVVGALVNTGVVDTVARAATDASGGNVWQGSMVLLWGSAVLSAFVDNIPYVATMSPIVDQMVHASPDPGQAQVLWWSLAIGADLGGNATAIGASANVVVLGIAARAGYPISFWEFTRYGLIVTAITVGLAVPYLYLRFFAFT